MIINKCPKCKDDNIAVNFDHNIRQYTLECFNCDKAYVLPHNIVILCPNCKGKKFTHTDYESYCLSCGLVMTSTVCYVAGFKINYPWGLRL